MFVSGVLDRGGEQEFAFDCSEYREYLGGGVGSGMCLEYREDKKNDRYG